MLTYENSGDITYDASKVCWTGNELCRVYSKGCRAKGAENVAFVNSKTLMGCIDPPSHDGALHQFWRTHSTMEFMWSAPPYLFCLSFFLPVFLPFFLSSFLPAFLSSYVYSAVITSFARFPSFSHALSLVRSLALFYSRRQRRGAARQPQQQQQQMAVAVESGILMKKMWG